jgi:hypothetical protein
MHQKHPPAKIAIERRRWRLGPPRLRLRARVHPA